MKVFLCEPIHPAAYHLLEQNAEIIADRDRMNEADALISRMITVARAEMDLMPDLKVIAVHGTGTDGIDLTEAKKRGIQVVYAPHMNANSVAELNAALLLTAMRKIVYARRLIDRPTAALPVLVQRPTAALPVLVQRTAAEGATSNQGTASSVQRASAADPASIQRELRGHELKGKTAGFIGFGAIGARTAEILHCGFGMNCIAWSPSLTPERAGQHFSKCVASAEEVIRAADALFLALPLTDATRGLMDRERLCKMKQGAVLINTSRAGLVDEEALREVLGNGQLGGAASDVLTQEIPDPNHPLLQFPNFVVTPHIGANTDEALYEVGMCCVRQILDVMSGREPEYPVQ